MKYYLTILNKEKHFTFIKVFENKKEKDKYKNKIRFIETLILIEDSEDIKYYG